MVDPIDQVFQKHKHIKIMTHVVAGYPSLAKSRETALFMAEKGAHLIEIQIPFSDPLADGPTIMAANQVALNNGITPDDCFRLLGELKKRSSLPLLLMTYCNIPFSMGMETFVGRSADYGADGLIIPDLPFDEQNENYLGFCQDYNIHPIQVISPGMEKQRLLKVLEIASGFVYATLKVGITGTRPEIEPKGLNFIETIRKNTSIPVAAGFGISNPEQVKELEGLADVAVIGSHLINLFNQYGLTKVGEFIKECQSIP